LPWQDFLGGLSLHVRLAVPHYRLHACLPGVHFIRPIVPERHEINGSRQELRTSGAVLLFVQFDRAWMQMQANNPDRWRLRQSRSVKDGHHRN